MPKLLLLLVLSASLSASTDFAQFIQQRFLPANGERGTLGDPQPYPQVQIGKRLLRLSPGARIYDTSNRTLVHGHLPSGAEVFFARDQAGDVNRIYILTEQEVVRLMQAGKR